MNVTKQMDLRRCQTGRLQPAFEGDLDFTMTIEHPLDDERPVNQMFDSPFLETRAGRLAYTHVRLRSNLEKTC